MRLLLTGAFAYSEAQLNALRALGAALVFQKDERGAPETDFAAVDAVVCNGLFLYHDIKEFKNLKCIQLTSAGLDRVPLDYIQEKGIHLYNARGVYSVPMAEWALCGVLSLYKHLNAFSEKQKNHLWEKDREVRELQGDTVLIVGCGSVGTACAERFKAFGMRVMAADIQKPQSDVYDAYFSMQEIDKALETADVIVLTLPLTADTRGFFRAERFSHCKNGAILVNIARGAVVKEKDLTDALVSGNLGGAVLDVFEDEPLPKDSPLWELENVMITPHNSFVSPKNNERLFSVMLQNIETFLKERSEK
ncbi:MAG: NAD(P)-dependent oxidoreductase [Clostridia bacterium]|nr:NAD(P)-dependent oxidoreductase [Clostridia bacterium]